MKPKYIHESRHVHAVKRERNKSGRFLSKKGGDEKSENDEKKWVAWIFINYIKAI